MSAVAIADLSRDLARLEESVRARASELLESQQVRMVIGHKRAWNGPLAVAHFAVSPKEARKFAAGPHCTGGLAKYLLEEREKDGVVAVIARGCDALGVRRLLIDRRVDAEKVLVLGVPCAGCLDPAKLAEALGVTPAELVEVTLAAGALRVRLAGQEQAAAGPPLDKVLPPTCMACEVRMPVEVAEMLGGDLAALTALAGRPPAIDLETAEAEVTRLEELSADDRYAYWAGHFQRCLRCFACRNACPACNCRVCALDSYDPKWLGHPTEIPEQFMFHFIRAVDVAGRCVACGECERACPVGLPLMQLNRKFSKDIRTLFGVDRPHLPGEHEPLGKFEPDDPEEFM
ncbi:MAG: Coenzyme F420 hydrogenase/dehydrogenase, beta subunit C-terminal domain [Bacillota bacterium]|nr:Coenzyme F420 hydrogenase/dehydrogenase, beta subunit C-terminal domain [Bacillota bacterium]